MRGNAMGSLTSNDGGGFYNKAPTGNPLARLNLYNTTVSGNNANHGGGIYNGGALTITDSAISRNVADSTGGGVSDSAVGSTTVTRSTIRKRRHVWGRPPHDRRPHDE